jgi:hypothetical protein
MLRLRTAKPHGERPARQIVINIYFGHILSPSLMASLASFAVRTVGFGIKPRGKTTVSNSVRSIKLKRAGLTRFTFQPTKL